MPEVWHKKLVRVGTKGNVPTKELIRSVEHFEERGRKFPRKSKGKHEDGHRTKFQRKKSTFIIPGCDHEWKDFPKNRFNKAKKEESNNASDGDGSSVLSSDESTRMMKHDSGSDETTVLSVDSPELTARKIWLKSDDDSSTIDTSSEESEGSECECNHEDAVPEYESEDSSALKLLSVENGRECSDEEYEETHQQKSARFQDEMQKLKEKKESKEQVLGSEILTSTKAEGSEREVLLALADSGSSKTLVKKGERKEQKTCKCRNQSQ